MRKLIPIALIAGTMACASVPTLADSGVICGAAAPNCAIGSGTPPTPSTTRLPNGAIFDTTFPLPNKMHISITPPPGESDTTENVYFALLVGGKLYFETIDGKFSEHVGGAIPALYTHAQSQCKSGNSFGFSYSYSSLSSFTDLARMMPGAILYAGYGINEADMLNNAKYAVVYTVPLK